jgi:glycosyltransferase involved in cell wall biosynthesis
MAQAISIGIPACNEERSIAGCLESIAKQVYGGPLRVFVCINGCDDQTEQRTRDFSRRHPSIRVEVIHSRPGIALALNRIVSAAMHVGPADPLLLMDADVVLCETFVESVVGELGRNDRLLVVGGWPVPRIRRDVSLPRQLLQYILHVRAFHPEAEISTRDVTHFKSYVNEMPQPCMTPRAELRSKIFFHGRAYLLRNPTCFFMPQDASLVDDTFLANFIHTKHGAGTIRTRYDAICYYEPHINLSDHFSAYLRYYMDKKRIDRDFPEFAESRRYEKTRLNWPYILRSGPSTAITFLWYAAVKTAEEAVFSLLPERDVGKMWLRSKGRARNGQPMNPEEKR